MEDNKLDNEMIKSVISPEPHHWRSGSDEPVKPQIEAFKN
jgi:hypothetical protein